MSSLIKSTLLRSSDQSDECLVDSVNASQQNSRRQAKRGAPQDQAQAMLAQAREQAEDILVAARQEAELLRSEARGQGYEEGLAELDSERLMLAEKVREIEETANGQVEQFWEQIEPELLGLSVAIAKKIIRHEVEMNDGFVLETVKTSLRQLRDRQDLKVRVNPADYELVRGRKEDIAGSCDGVRTVEVIDDRRVDQGGCILESGSGTLDARLDSQIVEVERALMEAAEHGNCEMPSEA